VTALAEAAGVALSTVSQQLRLLRAEHLVTPRRAAKHVYHALALSWLMLRSRLLAAEAASP